MLEMSEKKRRILQAALEVFSRHPFHQVKMEQIAEKAGVGKGTIYEYFRGKEDLFVAMARAATQTYFADIVSSVNGVPSAREKLKNIFYYHLRFISMHNDIARILVGERRPLNDEFKQAMFEWRRQMEHFITDLVRYGIKSGEFRDIDAVIVSQVIMGTLSALWGYMLFQEHSIPETEEVVTAILDFYLNGLERRPDFAKKV